MDIGFARALFALAGEDASFWGYCGRFPDEHSARLIELGEVSRSPVDPVHASKGRSGYILVEAYQNIIRHQATPSAESPWYQGRSLFLFRTARTGRQRLTTRNPVTTEQAEQLQQALENLARKDAAGLKQLFMEGLLRSTSPGQRGAGLGLIEMTRRAERAPRWSFTPLDADHRLFTFTIEIGGAFPGDDGDAASLMLEKHLLMAYVGPWSAELGKILLSVSQVEVGPRAGRSSDRESVWGLVSSVVLPLFADRPVLFALHHGDRPVLSVGGTMSTEQAGGFHSAMQGTDLQFSFGDTAVEGQVLALVHLPW